MANDNAAKKTSLIHKISTKILLFILVGIVLIMGVFFYTSYVVVTSVYETFFSDKTIFVNHVIATQIGGSELIPYIEAITADLEFRKDQLAFFEARQRLRELENEPPSEETDLLWEQVHLFFQKNRRFKDENYERIQTMLEDLRVASGAKYLYIFADTGLPGFLTYIVDAHPPGDYQFRLDVDSLGTVAPIEDFYGSEHAFASKLHSESVIHDAHEYYGELFSSFSPLFDNQGNVVAVIGTDFDLSEMNRRIWVMLMTQIQTAVAGSSLLILVLYFLLRRIVVKPIVVLTNTAASIADGHVYATLPPWLLRQKDEMGRLGRALSSMAGTSQNLLSDAKHLFDAAMAGKLDARIEPSNFKGDFALFARQINDTLDIIGMYFDSMPEAIFILDTRLDLAFRNKQYINIFGHMTPKEVVRVILCDQTQLENADPLDEKWNDILAKGVYTTSTQVSMRGGADEYFAFTCCDLVLNGVKRGSVVIAGNITALMEEKAKAQSASQAKGEFLSRVSHELRSPMNVIIGMAKLGLKNADGPSRERFENIVSASGHLLRVINDVLDMSSIESGKLTIRYASFNLRGLVYDCTELLRQQAEEKNISLSANIDPGIVSEVFGDGPRLSQILINLLTNSIKFTEAGGRITVSTTALPEDGDNLFILFSVEDTGIGMSEDFMRKMFVPFEQEDGYLQRRHQGTGLGLSICNSLVGLMGGTLEVESRLGEGSRFFFAIPFLKTEDGPREAADTDTELSFDFSGLRLLLVDDIAMNRLILIESLADTKIAVTEAGDGAEALKILKNSPEGYFDVIFMDIQMPRMDGYQATKAIRALARKDAKLPIIAMTANALKEDVELALAHGMTDHISKPVDLDTCARTLSKIAGAKKKM